jgi:hypothetical protein
MKISSSFAPFRLLFALVYLYLVKCSSVVPEDKYVLLYSATNMASYTNVLSHDSNAAFVIDSSRLISISKDDAVLKQIKKSKQHLGLILNDEFFFNPPRTIYEYKNFFKLYTGINLKFVLVGDTGINTDYFVYEFKRFGISVINKFSRPQLLSIYDSHLLGKVNVIDIISSITPLPELKKIKSRLSKASNLQISFGKFFKSISKDAAKDNDEIDPFSHEFDLMLGLETSKYGLSQNDRIYLGFAQAVPAGLVATTVNDPDRSFVLEVPDQLFIQTCTIPDATNFIFKGLRNYSAIQCFVSSISILVSMQELRENAQLAHQVIADGHELVLELIMGHFDGTPFSIVKTEFLNLTGSALTNVYVPPRFPRNLQGFSNEHRDLKLVTPRNVLRSTAQLDSFRFNGLVLVDLDASPSILLRGLAKKIEKFANEPLSLTACLTNPAGASLSVQTRLNNLLTSLAQRFPRTYLNNDIYVRRDDQLLSDSFNIIQRISNNNLGCRRFRVYFRGEEGIDAGGLTTEWYSMIMRELVNPHYALFKSAEDDQATFHINESSFVNPEHLQYFRMTGQLLAKGLYDALPLQFSFTRSLQKIMLGRPLLFSDLSELDQTLVNSLNWIADNEIAGVFDEMTFSIDHEVFGERRQVDLKPNGSTISVTDENKFEYIRLVISYRLYLSSKEQIDAFLDGLYSFIPKNMLEVFSIQEWNSIISGSAPLDVDDWQRNTRYSGNYNAQSIQVVYFWQAVRSFTDQDRRQLLKFVTGTRSVPLEGFSNLRSNGHLSLFKIGPSSNSVQSLPLGHTCFCSIDVPRYPTYEILRAKLLTAIYEGDGAFLMS